MDQGKRSSLKNQLQNSSTLQFCLEIHEIITDWLNDIIVVYSTVVRMEISD